MTKQKNKGAYKPTGNLTVDMCAACMWHYERRGGKVKEIYLSKRYWWDFNRYMLQQIPGHIDTGEVDFDGTIIKKASLIQIEPMRFLLEGKSKSETYN